MELPELGLLFIERGELTNTYHVRCKKRDYFELQETSDVKRVAAE